MADIQYVTKQGDMIDAVCFKHYGTTSRGVVEAVLEANIGLADEGATLDPGIVIVLPDFGGNEKESDQPIRLWG